MLLKYYSGLEKIKTINDILNLYNSNLFIFLLFFVNNFIFKINFNKMICKGIDMAEYLKPVHPIIEPDDDKGGLFLGNVAAAKNLKKLSELKIGAVLTVACGARIKYP